MLVRGFGDVTTLVAFSGTVRDGGFEHTETPLGYR